MKKKILVAVSGILAAAVLTACGQTAATTTYNGSYWNKDTSDEIAAGKTETLEYNVYATEEKDGLWNKTQANSVLSFKTTNVISESGQTLSSSYKTTLTAADDGTYVYKTTLNVYGEYETNENTYSVNDVTTTETVFGKFDKNFAPIKSVKTVSNTVPFYSGNAYEFKLVHYESTVTYADGTASVSINVFDDDESPEQFKERAKKVTEVSKYNKSAYIDMNLMLLMFRNFKHEANMSYSFKTVEPLSGELQSVSGSIYTKTSTEKNSSSLEYLSACSLSNVAFGNAMRHNYSFNVVRMDFSTTGSTGQTFMRAFYAQGYDGATEANSARHIPVMIAQPTIFNTGFLVYELKTANLM